MQDGSLVDKLGEGPSKRLARELCIILPALNEAKTVGTVIQRIPLARLRGDGLVPRVLVVDGKSVDATCDVARLHGAEIVAQVGRGKGNAIRQVHQALKEEAAHAPRALAVPRYFVVLDADATYPPERIPDLVEKLASGANLVLASRLNGTMESGAMTNLNRLGNSLLTGMFRLLNGVAVSDACTGMYGFDEEVFHSLDLKADGFDVEADIFSSACLAGARIDEVEIHYGRRDGTPRLTPLRAGIRIAIRIFLRRIQGLRAPSKPVSEMPARDPVAVRRPTNEVPSLPAMGLAKALTQSLMAPDVALPVPQARVRGMWTEAPISAIDIPGPSGPLEPGSG